MFEAYVTKDIALRLPVEITSITFQNSTQSILTGGKNGHLHVYTFSETRKTYDLTNICKTFKRKMINDMSVCEQEEILFCSSDGILAAHRLGELTFTVQSLLHRVKPIHTFTQFFPKGTGGRPYIVVSSKKRLYLFAFDHNDDGDKDFVFKNFEYNQSFIDSPSCLRILGDQLFFSVRDEYFVMNIKKSNEIENNEESWIGEARLLFNFSGRPDIVVMKDRELVGFLRNDVLIVTNVIEKKTILEIKYNEAPLQVVYDSPFILALLPKGKIDVRSSFNGKNVQNIVCGKAIHFSIAQSGNVIVNSPNDFWMLDTSPNLRKNVSALISDREFDLAIHLSDNTSLFTEENKIEIKRQAASNLFNQKKFEESFALHAAIKTDVSKILQLFPELLPEQIRNPKSQMDMPANDRLRAMLALGNYLSAIRTDVAHQMERAQKGKVVDDIQKLFLTLRIVDTTLLKCFLKTKPTLVDSLLRLQNNACSFDDAESILKESGRLTSLYVLYESRKKHNLALNLLIDQSSRDNRELFFDGIERIVEYLQSLGNSNLEIIFHYAKWVLCKDLDAGVSIFTHEETDLARNLDRRAVVDFLKKECVAALIPYLEHIIFEWNENETFYHEMLLEHYVIKVNGLFKDYVHAFPDDENMTKAGEEEGDLGKYRLKLIKFLKYSATYSPQTVLLQLTPKAFYEERALILGRLKQHEQALMIYVGILKNIAAAESYCELYFSRNDEANSKVYLHLYKALVSPPDASVLGVDDIDLVSTNKDVFSAIKILSKHADKIDTVTALSLLPADTPLRVVGSALNSVLQTTHDYATSCNIQKSVSTCALRKKEVKQREAEATKIVVNPSSECVVCGKKIALSAFAWYKDGTLAHFYCYNDRTSENPSLIKKKLSSMALNKMN